MRFLAALAWGFAAIAAGQSPLDADLERAAERFEPAAKVAPDEVDQLAALAGEHYRAGRIDEAVAALDRGAAIAFRKGATGLSYELSLTAAEALRTAGRAAEASGRFQQAALTNSSDPRAAAAHYTAITTYASTLKGAGPEALSDFQKLLDQHLATWPGAPSAEEARWQRVELLARRGQWDSLLEAANTVDPKGARGERAAELVATAHRGLLATDSSTERFAAASADLQPLILTDPTRWPDRWSKVQRLAALVLARGAMDQGPEGVEYACRLLRQALTGAPPAEDPWRRKAAATMVVASLAAGQTDEVAGWMKLAYGGDQQEAGSLLTATHRRVLAREVPLAVEADRLAETLTQLVSVGDSATPAAAQALADSGRLDEAVRVASQLAAARPDDRSAQVEYAQTLSRRPDAANREAALARWRAIELRCQAGSPGWFEARLERLRLLVSLGRREDAQKLLALTRVLAPTLGGDAMRSGFDELSQTHGDPPPREKVASP